MSASAVQFRGVDPVIDAYELNNVPNWALFCGKNIFGQYTDGDITEGANLLRQWLEKLAEGGSGALYQLRMYKKDRGDITNTTEFNYSFSFKLGEISMGDGSFGLAGTPGFYQQITDRLGKIEKKLSEEKEEPETMSGIAGFFERLLSSPDTQQMVIGVVGHVIGRIFGGRQQQPASMAGVPGQPVEQVDMSEVYNGLPADQRAALDEALQILLTGDPLAGSRLLKIARILQTDPGKYELLAKML